MSTLGPYCKAYPVYKFRESPDWKEPEESEFGDEEILFLHEDYSVTDNIYVDEGVIFEGAGADWRAFCTRELDFQVPAFD